MSKPTCEETLQIDLAEPAIRRVIDMHGAVRGEITWCAQDNAISSVAFEWNNAGACLTLSWTADGVSKRQVIRTTKSMPYFGGSRLWLCCPVTRRRVRAVFLPKGAAVWAGRAAYSLPYLSQRVSRSTRGFQQMLSRHSSAERRTKMRRQLRANIPAR